MIHDLCDYCYREFGYQPGEKAICPSCGLENVRQQKSEPVPSEAPKVEAAMIEPAAEQATLFGQLRGRKKRR
jgi:hypothetical protein